MSSFWSAWIIILTVISFILMCWLLFSNRKITVRKGQKTTGHIYDGIEEYDNPMPAWWINMFLITIIYGVIYLIVYPGMGNFPGLLNWTSVGQWEDEVDSAKQANEALYQSFSATPVEALSQNKKAMRIGKRVFANNCAVCHGNNAKGAHGFPNLTDSDWLYGGTAEHIKTSIIQGRNGAMPAWEAVLGVQGLDDMATYVKSLSAESPPADNQSANTKALSDRIQEATAKQFATTCSACHGADGKGNIAVGAPNLTDDIWLYGGSKAQIRLSLSKGRFGQMPAHGELLSAEKIHLLTAYVYQLSER